MNDTNKNKRPVAVLGIPFDHNSSFLAGAAQAPARIREVLHEGSTNLCAENGLDLENNSNWRDYGDMELHSAHPPFEQIERRVAGLLDEGQRVLSIGGDHSITLPIVRAYARKLSRLNLLVIDAHPDLYDNLDDNIHSHACQFARIMEQELVVRMIQVGVRTLNPHQREQATRFGVEIHEMSDGPLELPLQLEGPTYLSVDLDAFDPSCAPGVSHHEPGGFSTREVLYIIQHLRTPLVGADIVEFNPTRDPLGITAMLAVKLQKEILGLMLGGPVQ